MFRNVHLQDFLGTSNKRIQWVDTAKYICILFVILSHVDSDLSPLIPFYTPFFLKGFFFLSGYVYRAPSSFKRHIEKKTKELLIPWFIWSNVDIILSSILSFNSHQPLKDELINNLFQIRGSGDGLWFINALFVAYIPFYFIIKKFKLIYACVVSGALSVICFIYSSLGGSPLPWHIEYMFTAAFWMVLGLFFKKMIEPYFDKLNSIANGVVLFLVYIAFVYVDFEIFVVSSYLNTLIGILFLIAACKTIKANIYINFVGQNTLAYFAFHGKVISILTHFLPSCFIFLPFDFPDRVIGTTISDIVITLFTSLILIIPTIIVKKIAPWSLGRWATK